jgi:two-component system, OmpR family, KDP operon response regulator KdpE
MEQRTLLLEYKAVVSHTEYSISGNPTPETLYAGDIALDPERRTVKKCGQLVHLTPKEFDLTHQLMRHPGRPIRHTLLIKAVWGSAYGTRPEYLRIYMRQLRKKLEDDPGNPQYFLTHSHFGYYFSDSL